MNIEAEQIVEVLNARAVNEPLIREILRSAAYEAALKAAVADKED